MSVKASLLVAAGLLIVAFVVGVVVGRAAREKPKTVAMASVKSDRVSEWANELAACREEWAVISMPNVSSSAVTPVIDESKRSKSDEVAKLEEELEQCKKQDFLHEVDMCLAPSRYGPLLIAGLHAEKACMDRFGISDLILSHLEQCPDYAANKPEYDTNDFSPRDQSKVGRVIDDPRRFPDRKGNHERHMQRLVRECRVKFGLSDN